MRKRQASIPAGQFAFSFDAPAPAQTESSLAGLDREASATVALMLKEDSRDRWTIAAAMSALLGEDVSKPMLDQYAAESKDGFNISFARMLALTAATSRFDLLDLLDRLVRRTGAALLVGEEIKTAQLGHIDRQIARLRAERRSIESVAPLITGGRSEA